MRMQVERADLAPMLPHNPVADAQPQPRRPPPAHSSCRRVEHPPRLPKPRPRIAHDHMQRPLIETNGHPNRMLALPILARAEAAAIACAALFSRCSITCLSFAFPPRTAGTAIRRHNLQPHPPLRQLHRARRLQLPQHRHHVYRLIQPPPPAARTRSAAAPSPSSSAPRRRSSSHPAPPASRSPISAISSANPSTAVSGLFSACATPPANCPSPASFSALQQPSPPAPHSPSPWPSVRPASRSAPSPAPAIPAPPSRTSSSNVSPSAQTAIAPAILPACRPDRHHNPSPPSPPFLPPAHRPRPHLLIERPPLPQRHRKTLSRRVP